MALKPLTTDERARARDKATAARTVRADAKARLKSGKASIAAVIDSGASDEAIGRMKVSEMLESLPGVGKKRSAAIMTEVGISPSRRIRGLGVHQRKALIDYLTAH
ncbi:DNA-binding protein [Tersicoccus phoenicis]|uniref:DNA-binding protein n=1 Tax=Tersicoccus phoenicis TaxID=554083 RepID=A0A1R1LEV8_9MICC|nr:integration host factor, actinobacterial type [Tersicoccus phoenicis]OMH26054.1 DNA-binding protein [Tersicoccus phoenicis]